MRVVFLGTGSWNAQGDRMGPAFLAEAGKSRLLVDAGEGCARRLIAAGVDPASLTAVLVTHLHPDHLAGLLPLLFFLRVKATRKKPLDLYGPPGLDKVVAALPRLGDARLLTSGPGVRVHEIEPGVRRTLGGMRVRAEAVAHTPGAMGYRVEADGAAVALSGDSAPCVGLVKLARGADLFVCEAAVASPFPGHMTPEQAGAVAAEADARALALIHIDPAQKPSAFMKRARRVYAGSVFAPRDLDVWTPPSATT